MTSELSGARVTLTNLLNIARITRVLLIEDELESEENSISVEEVIAVISEITPEDRHCLLSEEGIESEEGIWEEAIRAIWENESYSGLLDKLYQHPIISSSLHSCKQKHVVSALASLFSGSNYSPMTYSQWRKEDIETLVPSGERALILIDYNLSKEGGSTLEGMKLIEEIDSSDAEMRFPCALLSNDFRGTQEHSIWTVASKEIKKRFIPISKDHLTSDRLTIVFAQGIWRVILNPILTDLQNEIGKMLGDARREALQLVEDIDVFDMDHILAESWAGGAWPPDTLLRLQREIEKDIILKKSTESNTICSLAMKLISMGTIDIHDSVKVPPSAQVITLRQKELYDESEIVNSINLPIDVGDIFKQGENNYYILLSPPCDLVFRDKTKRQEKKVALLPIKRVKEGVAGSLANQLHSGGHVTELPYYPDSGNWVVCLNRPEYVSLDILDLCSFNKDGLSKIGINDDCPVVSPRMTGRFEKLKVHYRKLIDKCKQLNTITLTRHGTSEQDVDVQHLLSAAGFSIEELRKLAKERAAGGSSPFKSNVDIDAESVTYDCCRIRRICRDIAVDLLTKYAQCLARHAMGHNYAKGVVDPDTNNGTEPMI